MPNWVPRATLVSREEGATMHYKCGRCGSDKLIREPRDLCCNGHTPAANAFVLRCEVCAWAAPEYVLADSQIRGTSETK